MSGKNILAQKSAHRNGNGRTLAEAFVKAFTPHEPDSPGAIKYRLRFLTKTYGRRLALWPTVAQDERRELMRRLRKLESEGRR